MVCEQSLRLGDSREHAGPLEWLVFQRAMRVTDF